MQRQQADSFKTNNSLIAVLTMPNCFSAAECARIVELDVHKKKTIGITRGEYGQIRDSRVCFISPDSDTAWLFSKLQAVVVAANEQFRFHLSGFHEPLQLAEYASGGHYDWHRVRPVTRGVRRSLVAWIHGNSFS